jgi:hypothetical protein
MLGPGWRVKDQADACRSAALAFAWCAGAAWGKRELARWLVGPYARAVEAAKNIPPPRPSAPRTVAEESVRDLLERSHAHVLAVLRASSSWASVDGFARHMIDGGLVVGVIDEDSAIGYAPVASAEMRLVDRVSSLFIADYLTRPDDYAYFRICDGCDGATFDSIEEHTESCREAAPASGTRRALAPRVSERRITLVGLGERAA